MWISVALPLLTFVLGSLMTWLLSGPARKLANLEHDEKIQQRQDRSIGQQLLVISSVYRQHAAHPNLFSEEEMRDWLQGDDPLRLHAALRLLKAEVNAKPAHDNAGYWVFD